MSNRSLGAWGEAVAVRHLKKKGYSIRERNWHTARGELDLVAEDGETIVIVEVKTRATQTFGPPEEAITPAKRRSLLRTAWIYMERNGLMESDWRVDVIAIEGSPRGGLERIEHYQNVLEAEPGVLG